MALTVNGLLIKPAGPDCNLACRYCFYIGKKTLFPDAPAHRMTMDTMRRTLSEYLALAGPAASIGFQGGEPTLCGPSFFRETFDAVERYRKPGQRVNLSLQTNGMLLNEEWARLLRERDVLVGLSIDGPADAHDAYRRDPAGRPTHARVEAAMALLRAHGVSFNTLTVVTRGNVGRAGELFDYLCERGSGAMQFIPCFESEGGADVGTAPAPDGYAAFLIAAFDRWYNDGKPVRYVRMFDELLTGFMEYRSPACTFSPACAANLVVEHDGSVYPCDFFVEPRWRLGNIHDRTLAAIADDPLLSAFVARKRDEMDERCGACRFLPLCWGDCPRYRLSAAGEPERRGYYCGALQEFFAHALPGLAALRRSLLTGGHPRASLWRAREAALSRNDPCPCGSGRKFKKCCAPLREL